jgi:hypothetical protein
MSSHNLKHQPPQFGRLSIHHPRPPNPCPRCWGLGASEKPANSPPPKGSQGGNAKSDRPTNLSPRRRPSGSLPPHPCRCLPCCCLLCRCLLCRCPLCRCLLRRCLLSRCPHLRRSCPPNRWCSQPGCPGLGWSDSGSGSRPRRDSWGVSCTRSPRRKGRRRRREGSARPQGWSTRRRGARGAR